MSKISHPLLNAVHELVSVVNTQLCSHLESKTSSGRFVGAVDVSKDSSLKSPPDSRKSFFIIATMINLFLSILLTTISLSTRTNNANNAVVEQSAQALQQEDPDFDFIDAYKFAIGRTVLFGNYDSFISNMCLPITVVMCKTILEIKSKPDLDKVIESANNPDIVTLRSPGMEMWFAYDNYIIPFWIDFRKTYKTVTYGSTKFDRSNSVEQFKKQFPKSSNPSSGVAQSLFEIVTKEKGSNLEHYRLLRRTKDDPDETPMVEFTFENGKLIFIFFANFG
jgi:hypothetical protein